MTGATILHVSDLHFGHTFLPEVGDAVLRAAREIGPDATVISGDFVQRGDFPSQFAAAREFVEELPEPWLAVPGNHDLPLWNPLRRLIAPFAHYRRHISAELDPLLEVRGAVIAGINTARPFILDLGHVAARQLERAKRAFAAAPPDAVRVAVMHHPLIPQPETGRFFRQHVYGNRRAIAALAEAGADVVLSGHLHFPRALPARDYLPSGGGLVVVQAGTATCNRLRRGSGCTVQAFNVIRAREGAFEVEQWTYGAGRFDPRESASFGRNRAATH